MSHTPQKGYYASGVFKVDYKKAGYKDLLDITTKRSQDKGFYHLEVRKVSHENWGIQFVYCIIDPDMPSSQGGGIMRNTYKKELQDLYGDGCYAWDYYECDEIDMSRISVSKPLPIN